MAAGIRKNPVFAVLHTWPEIKNAEYEVLERLSCAATNIGATLIAIDNHGYPIWSNSGSIDRTSLVDSESIDFVISLHFESPRLFDAYSYYALWQPLEFYDVFGYEKSVESVLSHSDALSCKSEPADDHATNIFSGTRVGSMEEFPNLFHSPPKPYYTPKIHADSKIFYIGINWERINSSKGRHHFLLEMLDAENLIDIYGPRMFQGVAPWQGFKAYRGELPFDGKSVVRAVNRSGICLALSSLAHQRSEIMSNRLFEGLAAGAAIIANENRFIERYFSDVVYTVSDTEDENDLFHQVKDVLLEIRANPKEATKRALEGQRRLGEMFSLEGCLEKLIQGHGLRKRSFQNKFLGSADVTVIFVYLGSSLAEVMTRLADLSNQLGVKVNVTVICDAGLAELNGPAFFQWASEQKVELRLIKANFATTNASKRRLTGEYIRQAIED